MSKIKISIPESWKEISLDTYVEISKIVEKDETKYVIELLLILCPELSRDIINSFDSSYLDTITLNLQWMIKQPSVDDITKQFMIGKDIYKYEREFDKMTFGEMVSYETLVEQGDMKQSDTLPLVLAIILRKVVDGVEEDFNSDIIMERKELFSKELNIDETMGLLFFFRNGGKHYITILADYLKQLRELKKEIME